MNGEFYFLLAGQFPSKILMSGMVCLWWDGFHPFVPPCGVHNSERIFNALIWLFACEWEVLLNFVYHPSVTPDTGTGEVSPW